MLAMLFVEKQLFHSETVFQVGGRPPAAWCDVLRGGRGAVARRGAALNEARLPAPWASASPSARILRLPSAAKMGKGKRAANRIAREVLSTKMSRLRRVGSPRETYLWTGQRKRMLLWSPVLRYFLGIQRKTLSPARKNRPSKGLESYLGDTRMNGKMPYWRKEWNDFAMTSVLIPLNLKC